MAGAVHFAVDTETTAFKNAYPVEIAAVKVDDLSIAFCQRIRTSAFMEPRAEAVHGISQASLANAPTETIVMAAFRDFLLAHAGGRNIVLVAHNARFDREVIENALQRCGLTLPLTWMCTMAMNRARKHKNNKLSDCCARAGIPYDDGHSALPDARMCALVFRSLFEDETSALFAEALAQVNAQEERERKECEDAMHDFLQLQPSAG
jgi:DNA polymerase III epsilon subunit-like protein